MQKKIVGGKMIDIFKPLVELIDKLIPDATKKIEALVAIETVRARVKQPWAISAISILFCLNFIVKSIWFKLKLLVYFNTVEMWVDVVFAAAVVSFLFGIPFKDLIKTIRNWRQK